MPYYQAHHTPRTRLKESQWHALARLWQAGEQGVDLETFVFGRDGFAWRSTLHRLARFSPEPLIEHFKPDPTPYSSALRITEAGRSFYTECWLSYRELYPLVDAPEPSCDE